MNPNNVLIIFIILFLVLLGIELLFKERFVIKKQGSISQ